MTWFRAGDSIGDVGPGLFSGSVQPTGQAQVAFGSIVGNVTDASGGAMSGADVKITLTTTNDIRVVPTDPAGAYTISTVTPGTYRVEITRDGIPHFRRLGHPGEPEQRGPCRRATLTSALSRRGLRSPPRPPPSYRRSGRTSTPKLLPRLCWSCPRRTGPTWGCCSWFPASAARRTAQRRHQ